MDDCTTLLKKINPSFQENTYPLLISFCLHVSKASATLTARNPDNSFPYSDTFLNANNTFLLFCLTHMEICQQF